MTMTLFTLLKEPMSLISFEQFEEQFVAEFPEMEQFYSFVDARYDHDTKYAFGEDIIGDTCTD